MRRVERRQRLRAELRTFALLGVLSVFVPSTVWGFTVNSAADTDDGLCETSPGDCTLREAINALNASGRGKIDFDRTVFALSDPASPDIEPASPLPSIRAFRSAIDGRGARVVIRGRLAGPSDGLVFESPFDHRTIDRITVRSLTVREFEGTGIKICDEQFTFCGGRISRVLLKDVASEENGERGIAFSASYVERTTVSGAVIKGNGGTGLAAFGRRQISRFTVKDCLFVANEGDGVLIESNNLTRASLRGNVIVGSSEHGLRVKLRNQNLEFPAGVDRLRLSGNRISRSALDGIHFRSEFVDIADTLIDNNLVVNNGRRGIFVFGTDTIDGVVFRKNTVTGNADEGMDIDRLNAEEITGIAYLGNVVFDNGGAGIVAPGSGGRIFKNAVAANSSTGIRIYGDENRISRNVMRGNTGSGISLVSPSRGNFAQGNQGRGNGNDFFDGACGNNRWIRNIYVNASDCIR